MPASEDYRQMANRSAQLAIGCSAPSVAQALLALGLEYVALAARLGEPAAMRQDPAGFGDSSAGREAMAGGMSLLAALLAAETIDQCRSSKRKSPAGAGLVRGLNNEPN